MGVKRIAQAIDVNQERLLTKFVWSRKMDIGCFKFFTRLWTSIPYCFYTYQLLIRYVWLVIMFLCTTEVLFYKTQSAKNETPSAMCAKGYIFAGDLWSCCTLHTYCLHIAVLLRNNNRMLINRKYYLVAYRYEFYFQVFKNNVFF